MRGECRPRAAAQSGYSIAEMLVVVAIIGILSLITVPQFINYQHSNQLKSGMRQFMSDVRSARQTAISQGQQTMISAAVGNPPTSPLRPGQYRLYIANPGGSPPWRQIGSDRDFGRDVFFRSSNFTDLANGDGMVDITFLPNGMITPLPANAHLEIATTFDIPRNSYDMRFELTGRVSTN